MFLHFLTFFSFPLAEEWGARQAGQEKELEWGQGQGGVGFGLGMCGGQSDSADGAGGGWERVAGNREWGLESRERGRDGGGDRDGSGSGSGSGSGGRSS